MALLLDSDRKKPTSKINKTKSRIIKEINEINGMAWVTKGREIENYIPLKAINALFSTYRGKPLGDYQKISEFLDKIKKGKGQAFLRDKVGFAAEVCPHITEKGISQTLDLAKQLDEVCKRIRNWNNLS